MIELTGVAKAADQVARFMKRHSGRDCRAQQTHLTDLKTWRCLRCGEITAVNQAPSMPQ